MTARRLLAIALLVVAAASALAAQFRGPKAELTPLLDSDGVRAGSTVRAALEVRLPDEKLHVQSNKPRDESLIATVLTVDAPAGVRVTELVFPKATDLAQEGQAQPLAVYPHEFAIGVALEIADSVQPGELVVPARLRYQACDDKMCFPPSTGQFSWTLRVVSGGAAVTPQHQDVIGAIPFGTGEAPPAGDLPPGFEAAAPPAADQSGLEGLDGFTVRATTGGYLAADDFLTFIGNAERGVKERGLFEGRGPVAILLIVLLGGLALNLTPCVLPMIPINLAIIGAGAHAASRARGFLLGGVYGGAMALVYGILGVVVILTAGTFGTINASPWFNLAIAVVFVLLGLAMFDVITIDFSRFMPVGTGGRERGTFLLAFSMGAVAALLAGACVAPVVIQVVLFSSNLYAQGTAVALALPFLLGVGMAVPWPLAGAGLAALPKPGAWMVRVKQVFGVLILATAVYYGYQAYGIFANRWVDATEVTSSVAEKLKEGWHASLAQGLETARREQKPVLIDLWATWCKNCLTMDKTTFKDPAVTAALDKYVKIKFQAEQPDEEPARSLMQRFDAVGLPTYVILQPKSPSAGN
jgi:thioredoxin:protein disulfide reductase